MLGNMLRQPLLHFLILGGLLFAAYAALGGTAGADEQAIRVGREQLLTLLQQRAQRFDRERFERELDGMSAQERHALEQEWLREEVLVREARALQLDRDDYVIRQRLARKLEFVTRGFVESSVEPDAGRMYRPVGEFGSIKIMGWEMTTSGYAGVCGWDFAPADAKSSELAAIGYRKGVPMGGDLTRAPKGKAPRFLLWAARDPQSGNIDRVQIVKGWLEAKGATHEKVFDVAWSGARKPGRDGKLPPVGNTVNVGEASWSNSIGAPELSAVWEDPEFKADQRAFYYARVIEIPTPRWTAYDAKRFGVTPDPKVPMTTQERAYGSPIWYTP